MPTKKTIRGLIRDSGITQRLFARFGLLVVGDGRFGVDPINDMVRLASAWNYQLLIFFDVGANVGQTALKALNALPRAEVYSFEPHPETFQELTSNVRKLHRFHPFNLALGSECKEVQMFEYGSSTLNSLVPNSNYAMRYDKVAQKRRVPCLTLDQFCLDRSIECVDVLKIDVEGAELLVLQGAISKLRNRAVRFVFVEFNDLAPTDDAFGGSLFALDQFLRPLNYRFIASYVDYIVTDSKFFSVSNALFALPPERYLQD